MTIWLSFKKNHFSFCEKWKWEESTANSEHLAHQHKKDSSLKILSLRIACLHFVCRTQFQMTTLNDRFLFLSSTQQMSVRAKFAIAVVGIQIQWIFQCKTNERIIRYDHSLSCRHFGRMTFQNFYSSFWNWNVIFFVSLFLSLWLSLGARCTTLRLAVLFTLSVSLVVFTSTFSIIVYSISFLLSDSDNCVAICNHVSQRKSH